MTKTIKESKLKTEKAKKAYKILHQNNKVKISEKCDCGMKILHNDGGNYHQQLKLKREEGRYWYKNDTTCKLVSKKWKLIHPDELPEKINDIIKRHGSPNIIIRKQFY